MDLDFNLEAGYYCGGMAEVLAEIYGVLGYNSCLLGVTLQNDKGEILDGHAVTLVLVEGKWIIEDPTFNVSLKNELGESLCVHEVMKNDGNQSIQVVRGETLLRKYISVDGKCTAIYDAHGEPHKKGDYFYIPKSQKYNSDFNREYYDELIEDLMIQHLVDFTTY